MGRRRRCDTLDHSMRRTRACARQRSNATHQIVPPSPCGSTVGRIEICMSKTRFMPTYYLSGRGHGAGQYDRGVGTCECGGGAGDKRAVRRLGVYLAMRCGEEWQNPRIERQKRYLPLRCGCTTGAGGSGTRPNWMKQVARGDLISPAYIVSTRRRIRFPIDEVD